MIYVNIVLILIYVHHVMIINIEYYKINNVYVKMVIMMIIN